MDTRTTTSEIAGTIKFLLVRTCISLSLLPGFIACDSRKQTDEHTDHGASHGAHSTSNSSDSLSTAIQDINSSVISNQQTVKPILNATHAAVKLNGYIAADPGRNFDVATRVGGRIEKLFVKYNNQFIRKGDRVLELYSPEIRASQEEYLYLLGNSKDKNLIESSKQKLLLMGLTTSQINNLEKTGRLNLTITVFSPHSGYVITTTDSAIPNSPASNTSSDGMKMGAVKNSSSASGSQRMQGSEVREGGYINKGTTIFSINDLQEVWCIVALDAEHKAIKTNTPVFISSEVLPKGDLQAKIDFIEPVYSEGTKFLQARIYLKNPNGQLLVNSLVTAVIDASNSTVLMLPATSVTDFGRRKIVWKKVKEFSSGEKAFVPVNVTTGFRSGEFIEIVSGLGSSEEVAKNAGYLLDPETTIK